MSEDTNEIAEMLHVDREYEPAPGTEGVDLDRVTGPDSDEPTEELINEAGGENDHEEL